MTRKTLLPESRQGLLPGQVQFVWSVFQAFAFRSSELVLNTTLNVPQGSGDQFSVLLHQHLQTCLRPAVSIHDPKLSHSSQAAEFALNRFVVSPSRAVRGQQRSWNGEMLCRPSAGTGLPPPRAPGLRPRLPPWLLGPSCGDSCAERPTGCGGRGNPQPASSDKSLPRPQRFKLLMVLI